MLRAYRHRRLRSAPRPRTAVAVPIEAVEEPEPSEALDACDAYVVLVLDPETDAVDSYGPLTGPDAVVEAERRRSDLDAGDLRDVDVRVVRHHALRVHG